MREVDTLSFGYLFDTNKDRDLIEDKIKYRTKKYYNKQRQEYYYVSKYKGYSFFYMKNFIV